MGLGEGHLRNPWSFYQLYWPPARGILVQLVYSSLGTTDWHSHGCKLGHDKSLQASSDPGKDKAIDQAGRTAVGQSRLEDAGMKLSFMGAQ